MAGGELVIVPPPGMPAPAAEPLQHRPLTIPDICVVVTADCACNCTRACALSCPCSLREQLPCVSVTAQVNVFVCVRQKPRCGHLLYAQYCKLLFRTLRRAQVRGGGGVAGGQHVPVRRDRRAAVRQRPRRRALRRPQFHGAGALWLLLTDCVQSHSHRLERLTTCLEPPTVAEQSKSGCVGHVYDTCTVHVVAKPSLLGCV